MTELFGNTPGITVLNAILVLMGMVMTPILWGIYKKLGESNTKQTQCLESIAQSNDTISKIFHEMYETRVRDTETEGRLKGINETVKSVDNKLERILNGSYQPR